MARGNPRIISKRYCLGSIDLAYKILGYPYRLCVVRSEGGPCDGRSATLEFRLGPGTREFRNFSRSLARSFIAVRGVSDGMVNTKQTKERKVWT